MKSGKKKKQRRPKGSTSPQPKTSNMLISLYTMERDEAGDSEKHFEGTIMWDAKLQVLLNFCLQFETSGDVGLPEQCGQRR